VEIASRSIDDQASHQIDHNLPSSFESCDTYRAAPIGSFVCGVEGQKRAPNEAELVTQKLQRSVSLLRVRFTRNMMGKHACKRNESVGRN
jgi:hypothetical protein